METKRFYGCWNAEALREKLGLSPCGYDRREQDEACFGCVDNPMTNRRLTRMIDYEQGKSAER